MLYKYIYVQVRENRFIVRNSGTPEGAPLQGEANFSHSKLLLGDFDVALLCLKPLVDAARGSILFAPFTSVVIHPLEKIDGGLAPLEERAFMELGEQAGATRVVLWSGPLLSDLEVVAKLKEK